MDEWQCCLCTYIYSEENGSPDDGIALGTKWDLVPEDWCCPECGASKADFEIRKQQT